MIFGHEYGVQIVHRDLKTENVMIRDFGGDGATNTLKIKIADFGFATDYDKGMAGSKYGYP